MPVTGHSEAGGRGALEIDRRMLLGAGAAGVALGLLQIWPHDAGSANAGRNIDFVVTDKRYPESLAFGRALVEGGARRLEVTDGLTSLWQRFLAPLWAQGPGIIAGMTSAAVWTGLSEQARGQWRRPLLVGRHSFDPRTGSAGHQLSASTTGRDHARFAEAAGAHWPQAMAGLVAGAEPSRAGTLGVELPASGADARLLISWKIV